jgi:pyrroline-5-carboxylate reductase
MTYGIIGVGAIGAAIVTGLCDGVQDAPQIVLSPRNASRAADFNELARDHATRGGTNEQFLAVLEQARVFDAVDAGLNRVLERLTRR